MKEHLLAATTTTVGIMTVNGTYIHNYNGGTISEILIGVIIHFA
jgi:hypothetical protein